MVVVVYQIYVFFPDEPKVGVKTMKSYITRMNQENVIRAILVAQQNLTPFAKTSISEMGSKYHLEIFQVKFHSLIFVRLKFCFCSIVIVMTVYYLTYRM